MLLYVLSVLGLVPNFQKAKCKRLLNTTMERIKLLEKRRQARLRQLHQDVIELLKRRKEHCMQPCVVRIWKELCLFSVYTKITDYCQFVQSNLKDIAGQRECPCGLEEPLAGLCFAALCCADLPELQDLRDIFAMKYGKQFVSSALQPNCHVDQEFLESLCAKDLSEARKQALLQEITTQYILKEAHDEEAESVDSFSIEGTGDVKDCNRQVGIEDPLKFLEIQGHSEREKIQEVGVVVQESMHINAGGSEALGFPDVANELANRKRTLEDRERHRPTIKRASRRKFWLTRGMEEDKNGGKELKKTADRDGIRTDSTGQILADVKHNIKEYVTTHMHDDVPAPNADVCMLPYVPQPTISHPPHRPPPPPPPPKRAPSPLPTLLSESVRRSHEDIQEAASVGVPLRCSTMANSYYLESYGSHVHPRLPKYEDLVADFSARKH